MKFNWASKNFSKEVSTFSFYKEFPEAKKILYCGKFDKPIESEDGLIVEANKEISFIDMSFDEEKDIQIFVPGEIINFYIRDDLEFTISEPSLNSESFLYNSIAKRTNTLLYAHLFYQHDNGSKIYLSSISGKFSTFYDQIKSALAEKNFGTHGIALILPYIEGSDTTLKAANYVLSKKHGNLTKMMNIIVKSSTEVAYSYKDKLFYVQDTRVALRPIFLECSRLRRLNLSDDINTLCRRIINNILNGGLPLNLFDELKNFINEEDKWNHSSKDYESFELNFESFVSSEESICEELKVPIHNLKNHFLKDSKEWQYRSMFWDQVLSILFHSFLDSHPLGYRLQSEWDTKTLFSNLESRSVDYVALFKQESAIKIPIPVFLSEIGYANFGVGLHSHKDFSKLLAIMSQSCIKMAKQLELSGKKAEDAIVFGSWIGGPQIHFVTTRAIITATERDDNSFQIHTHSLFPPEWKLNILVGTEETEGECQVFEAESNVCAEIDPASTESSKDISSTSEDIYYLESEEEEEKEEGKELNYFPGLNDIDASILVKCKSFVGHVVNHIEYLNSHNSNRDPNIPPRTFKCPDDKGFFQPARVSSMSKTPGKERIERANENYEEEFYPASPTPGSRRLPPSTAATSLSFSNNGRSFAEVQLYRKYLCHVPDFFPEVRALGKETGNEGKYEVVTEYMEYFVDPHTGIVSERLWFSGLGEGLVKALTASLQLLNSLDWLHRIFRTVHADISPYNIMFSKRYNTWKFIDFEYSLDTNLSLNTKRTCGTKDYIAQESLESGIFTEAADIYSLGTVFINFLWSPIIYRLGNRSSIPKSLESLISDFESVSFKMAALNPNHRPSAFDAMMAIFAIVRKLPQDRFDYGHPALERVSALFEENKQLESVSVCMEKVSIEQKVETETEQSKRSKLEVR